jgi:hypothetical protein
MQPRFMYEGRRLEGMTRSFVSHFVRGHPAQFVIDQRQQLISGLRIAVFDGVEDSRNVAHAF